MDTEFEDGSDEEISLEVPVEMLQTSAHFDLIFTHPEVLVDNKKVSKLLKTTSFKEKIKAIVVDEAHLVIDWFVDTFKLCSNLFFPIWLMLSCTLLIVRLVLTGIMLKRNLPPPVNESDNLIVLNG